MNFRGTVRRGRAHVLKAESPKGEHEQRQGTGQRNFRRNAVQIGVGVPVSRNGPRSRHHTIRQQKAAETGVN